MYQRHSKDNWVAGDAKTYIPIKPPVNFPVDSGKDLNKNVKYYTSPNAAQIDI